MWINDKNIEITTSFGEGSERIVINNAILMQVMIKPESDSTTYDFTLEDVNGKIVSGETNCQGEYNELHSLPVYGNYILNILNASTDELFQCLLVFRRS